MLQASKEISLLKTLVRTGGIILNSFRGKVENAPKKSDLPENKVQESSTAHTILDDAIQEVILEILYLHMPDIEINVEEETSRVKLFINNKSNCCFHLDPLDGTLAYIKNRDDFAIGAGFTRNLEFYASAIYFPAVDRLYFAEKGSGAYVQTNNNKVIPLKRPVKPANKYIQKRCEELVPAVKQLKLTQYEVMSAHQGMIALAEGQSRVVLYNMASVHDFGIPKIIVEEVGGLCTDLNGDLIKFDDDFNRVPYFFAFYDKTTRDEFFGVLKNLKIALKP